LERLELKNIFFSYEKDKEILSGISLTVNKGEIVSLAGVSGSGKTTLFQICANLLKQNSGELANGFSNLSFVFQEPRLLPWKNLIENISFPLISRDLDKQMIKERAESFALALGLKKEDFKKYPKELSGGMAQRVSLARALAGKPDILFLDEPFSGLDIGLKNELFNILIRLCKEERTAVFFITHDFSEALKLSDRILFLEKKQKGSVLSESLEPDMPQDKRDSEYVYLEMVELLKNKKIKKMFCL
jgi:NitT/TauT family transport system ATP-binding protein